MQRTDSMRWQVPASANGIRSLANPGSTPLMKMRRIALPSSIFHPADVLVGHDAPRELQQPGRGPDDVDPGGQDAHDVRHGVGQPGVAHRAVHDALGLGGDQRVEVVGGFDAGVDGSVQADAAELSGVLAHLLGRRHVQGGQFELRVGDELGQGEPSDISGTDVRDADRHARSPFRTWKTFLDSSPQFLVTPTGPRTDACQSAADG